MNCPVDYNCYYTIEKAFGPQAWVGPLAAIGLIIGVILGAIILYNWVDRRK